LSLGPKFRPKLKTPKIKGWQQNNETNIVFISFDDSRLTNSCCISIKKGPTPGQTSMQYVNKIVGFHIYIEFFF